MVFWWDLEAGRRKENEKMKITTVLFDLDGTLLPMDNDEFTKGYFKLLAKKWFLMGMKPSSL